MAVKRYNGTSWDTVAGAGTPGAAGIVTSATAPSDTSVLWADTTVTTNNALIPAGGTTGQLLSKTSSSDYATQWSTPSAGAVLQVKNAKATAFQQVTSTTLVDLTNLSISITPSSASNKVLVLVNVNGVSLGGGTGRARIALTDGSATVLAYLNDYATLGTPMVGYSLSYLDAPATTSVKTYKLMGLTDSGASFYVQNYQSVATVSTITVMEVTP